MTTKEKEMARVYRKRWKVKNRDKVNADKKRWRLENPEKTKAAASEYQKSHPHQRRNIAPYASRMYSSMVKRAKLKSRECSISKSEFLLFLGKSRFNEVYAEWKKAGFPRKLSPSLDRIKELKGYHLDNIQVLTVGENIKKYHDWQKQIIKNLLDE